MDASKENARRALDLLNESEWVGEPNSRQYIADLLDAAIKRLPTRASIDKDKSRKRTKAAKAKE